MKKENCKRKQGIKNKLVTVRINKEQSEWMKKEKLSPTAIFQEAMRELGYKEAK